MKAHYHHGDLRHALLEAALELITKKGVEGFSLREAARAVGVSAAATYRHFEDKSALLGALALDAHKRMATVMEEVLERISETPGTPERATAELRELGAAYVEFAVANPSRFQVMFGPWCDHPAVQDLPPDFFPRGRDPYQLLVGALDKLVQTSVITPAARQGAEIAAWVITQGLASLFVVRSLQFTAAERFRTYRALTRILLLGLGASPSLLGPAITPPLLGPHVKKAQQRAKQGKRRTKTRDQQ